MPTVIENSAKQMPILALRGMVVFPNTMASFDVGRKKSANALKYAMEKNQLIFLVAQKDCFIDEPEEGDLYKIGCVAKVKQVLRVSDNLTKVLVQGLYRATYTDFYALPDFYTAKVTESFLRPLQQAQRSHQHKGPFFAQFVREQHF